MTPKEKAIELVDKYRSFERDGQRLIPLEYAKQCALITVDEIMEELAFMWIGYGGFEEILDEREAYYTEVKQEIENL